MGGGESVTEPTVSAAEPVNPPVSDPACSAASNAPQKTEPGLSSHAVRLTSEAQKLSSDEEAAANKAAPVQDSSESNPAAAQQSVRRHGSAKPVV
jgi:hypothetical protein